MHNGHRGDRHRQPHPFGGLHADLVCAGGLREALRPLRHVSVGAKGSPTPGEVGGIGLRVGERIRNRGLNYRDTGGVPAEKRAEGPGGVGSHPKPGRAIHRKFASPFQQGRRERRTSGRP